MGYNCNADSDFKRGKLICYLLCYSTYHFDNTIWHVTYEYFVIISKFATSNI